jgi:predicted nucleotidyltransferase
MITQGQIDDVVDIIVKNVNPEKIILFGSYAYGEPQEDSDLDILVVKDIDSDRYKRAREIKKYLRGLKIPIDVIVYTKAEIEEWKDTKSAFITQVMQNGRILYG